MTVPEPPAVGELLLTACTEPANTLEPKPQCESDQRCEPATDVPVRILVAIDSVLGHTSSASVLGHSGSTSDARHRGSSQASCASSVTRLHQLSVFTLGSPEIGSVSIGRPTDVVGHTSTLAPPSINAAVGCRLLSALGLQLLATPPIIAPMDAPTICASVESLPVCLPACTPQLSACSFPALLQLLDLLQSLHPTSIFSCFLLRREVAPSGRGRSVTDSLFLLCSSLAYP
ncbi:hypothetical protein H4Q32_029425 [Labeo rohita]|uniref:Uncharacterized protein n=1 Tax=Labeo rohita TaxID=84645 RepID=A0ABQ8LBL8_LABRO|nr:hypothetical protein H4Q32_029425 [Labeo rohita]